MADSLADRDVDHTLLAHMCLDHYNATESPELCGDQQSGDTLN